MSFSKVVSGRFQSGPIKTNTEEVARNEEQQED